MGFLSKFEGKVEDTFEGAAEKVFDTPISPVQIAKKAERQMKREKMVGAGKQYAPTLYTVLVNPEDDQRLFGYYPTLAGETETYLVAKAHEFGYVMDGQPLVRFIVDENLKRGKFDVIAEAVAAPIIIQLRNEEMQRYGLAPQTGVRQSQPMAAGYGYNAYAPAQSQQSGGYAPRGSQPFAGQQSSQPYPARNASQPYNAPRPSQPNRVSQPAPSLGQQPYQRNSVPSVVPTIEPEPYYGAATIGVDGYQAGYQGAANGRGALGNMAPIGTQTVVFNDNEDYDDYSDFDDYGNEEPMPRLVDLATSQVYPLLSTYLTLGRESSNDIQIQDINASRRHAELTQQPQGSWVITDVGSTNGTLVNGRAIASVVLQPGDYITMGTTEYLFEID